MLKQKEAVFNAVSQVMEEAGTPVTGEGAVTLSKEQRDAVVSIIVTGFEKGKIELESKQENLKSYTTGLVSNWLRKDKRLNGGGTYKPSNPGSRTGQSDPMVKNLRILASTLPAGSDAHTAVMAKIEARVGELKAGKAQAKAKDIDFNFIPDEIKELLGNE